MGGMLGGRQSTEVSIPGWLEDAARANIARADEISSFGYVPYYGPDVAAFTPMQQASFQNTGQAANAFGLAGGGLTGMEGMPQAQDFGGGVMGYSSAPLYEGALSALEEARPGQYDAITGMFIDPVTGAAPRSPFGPASGTALVPNMGGTQYGVPDNAQVGAAYGDGPQGSGMGGFGGGFMGYSGIGDMMDGGGPGRSGPTFSGGGAISSIGNAVGGPSGMGGGK